MLLELYLPVMSYLFLFPYHYCVNLSLVSCMISMSIFGLVCVPSPSLLPSSFAILLVVYFISAPCNVVDVSLDFYEAIRVPTLASHHKQEIKKFRPLL